MELNNITIGNRSVVKITMGNIQIYPTAPTNVFTVSDDEFTVDLGPHSIEVVVTSIVNGVATGVDMTITADQMGLTSGYVDGPGFGQRTYTFQVPYSTDYNDKQAIIRFRQRGTLLDKYVYIYQERT